MSTIQHLKKHSGGPYTKPLRCKVAAIGTRKDYTNQRGDKKSMVMIGLVDQTGYTKGIVYNDTLLQTITVGASVLLKNFISKPDNIVLTSTSKAFKCAAVKDVPEEYTQEAIK